jgi:hypothetical protein
LAALPYLRRQGGALIAISSVEAIVATPLHSAYGASKHAVEGFMDALRRELMAERAPISVTSIKPGTINTPFFNNSRNKLDVKPKGPPPIYDPAIVADCILYAAEHPVRDLFAGGAGKAMAAQQFMAPGLMDAALARIGIPAMRTNEPQPHGNPGNLYDPRTSETRARGDFSDRARRFSLYTWLELHPGARAALTAGGLLAGAALLAGRRRAASGPPRPRTPESRASTHDIREHMAVFGSDGERVGTVDHVKNGQLKLSRNDPLAGGQHHIIPLDLVASAADGSVRLTKPGQQVKQHWQPG